MALPAQMLNRAFQGMRGRQQETEQNRIAQLLNQANLQGKNLSNQQAQQALEQSRQPAPNITGAVRQLLGGGYGQDVTGPNGRFIETRAAPGYQGSPAAAKPLTIPEGLTEYLPIHLQASPQNVTVQDLTAAAAAKKANPAPPKYTGVKDGVGYNTKTGITEAVPMSPELKAERETQKANVIASQRAQGEGIMATVDEALKLVEDSGGWVGGMTGATLSNVPGTDAYYLESMMDTVVANLAFGRLEQMRNASKTGGALGAVSERELKLLGATITNLTAPGLSPAQKLANLKKVKKHYEAYLAGLGNFGGGKKEIPASTIPPGYEGVWGSMTDAEKEAARG